MKDERYSDFNACQFREICKSERNAVLEEAEDAMLAVFEEMNHVYLFTSGFDSRIIQARDAIRALKRPSGDEQDADKA